MSQNSDTNNKSTLNQDSSNNLINDELSFMKKSSFSDFEVGAKFRIFDKTSNNTKVAFLSHLSIPTAIEVFSNNVYGILSRLNVSHDLNNDSQIGYNLGYNKFKKMDGQFIYTIVYGRSLDSFGIFFEIFGDDSKNSSNINFDSGITYLLDNKKQLDLSIGKGINNDMFFISGGIIEVLNNNVSILVDSSVPEEKVSSALISEHIEKLERNLSSENVTNKDDIELRKNDFNEVKKSLQNR